MVPSESKRASLAATFRKMPTDELQRRVASRQLAPVALELAELELQLRKQPPADANDPPRPDGAVFFSDARRDAIAVAIATLLALGAAWQILSPGHFFLTLLATGPLVLATLGKIFPRLGTALGLCAAALPFALGFWMWHRGEMVAKGGDYQVLGPFFAWIGLIVASVICWAIAAGLLMGAGHRGSWLDFNRKLQASTSRAIDKATGKESR